MRYYFFRCGAAGPLLACLLPALALKPAPELAASPTGIFGPPTTYAVGTWPRALAVADLDGDGRPDLITVNDTKSRGDNNSEAVIGAGVLLKFLQRQPKATDVGSATLWLGLGGGRFGARHDYPLGRFPAGLALADFTGDGRTDLLTTGSDAGRQGHLYVLAGQGPAGGLGPARPAPFEGILRQPENLVLNDLNADGRPDVVTAADTNEGGIQVRLGRADGQFGSVTNYSTGPHYSAQSVVLADLDRDGNPDAVVTNGQGYNPDSTVVVLAGQGAGTFGPPRFYDSVRGPTAVADLNGDGRPDLLAASAHALTVRSGGPAGFGPAGARPGLGISPNSLTVADVNGDGRPDLVTTHHRPGRTAAEGSIAWAALRLAVPGGGWGAPTDYALGPSFAGQVHLTDLDADGRPDLVTINPTTNTVQVRLNQGP